MDFKLFDSLAQVRRDVARRTYGSSHATLIGLMSEWWIARAQMNTVLDGAPSFGAANAGWCDLMLCEADGPIGVVEVEGTRPLEKLQTIGRYLSSTRSELAGIQFGILVSYAYHVRGRGATMAYPPAEDPTIVSRAKQLSEAHPQKSIVLLTLDKNVDPHRSALRNTVKYYWGSLSKVTAFLYQAGHEVHRRDLASEGADLRRNTDC